MINISDKIREVVTETHLPMVETAFGRGGLDAAFRVMEVAKALYKHLELERVVGQVIIFEIVIGSEDLSLSRLTETSVDFASIGTSTFNDVILEVGSDGRAYRRSSLAQSPEDLAKIAVVYSWQTGREEFLAGEARKAVLRLDTVAQSQFAIPTFSNLREALQHYARENVRESTCYIFQGVWHGENRLFLHAGAEKIMRRSLTQFLRNRIGSDHDVWPEQVVDESHPVDIRIQPRLSNNRLMLIEIKWLGWSAAEDGHITAKHADRRAQEGADQLAQYLSDQLQSAPSRVIQGYYVIIDARRAQLREGAATITLANGMHFENQDLQFQPKHDKVRNDFDPPYRMFARPICIP